MENITIEENKDNIISNGLHYFSGVDDTTVPNPWGYGEDYDAKLFCIDGTTYQVYKDPDDGYRSYGKIEKSEKGCRHIFDPQPVMILNKIVEGYNDEYNFTEQDKHILVMSDAITGEEIMVIGTDYADGYYPMCIFEYHPENMYINRDKK